MMDAMRTYLLAALATVAACKGTDPSLGDDQPVIDAPDGTMADAYVPPAGYTKLIGRTWTLSAGQTDIYRCVLLTIPTDTYITSIEAQAPAGTHHTVLSIATGSQVAGPDGEYDCSVQTLGTHMLYASGVGTSPLDFPTDVGLKIPAGTQIHLNLHLYNASDSMMTGESAIWVKSQPTAPPMLAEMVFAGNMQFSVPSDGLPHDVVGTCTINQSYKMFALWPHMHKLATHQKIELLHSTTTTTLHDMDYSFGEQRYWLQSPEISVQQNDKVRVTCTYVNNTGAPVGFGDSSDAEMCFGGMYRYPSNGSSLFCVF
jgi:hypothetical protein